MWGAIFLNFSREKFCTRCGCSFWLEGGHLDYYNLACLRSHRIPYKAFSMPGLDKRNPAWFLLCRIDNIKSSTGTVHSVLLTSRYFTEIIPKFWMDSIAF